MISLRDGDVLSGAVSPLRSRMPVQIGSVFLSGAEVPSKLTMSGRHKIARQSLIGGRRVLHAQGDDVRSVELAGLFMGSDALSRAQSLTAMRRAGQPVTVRIAGLFGKALLSFFSYDYTRQGKILPYHLTLELLQPSSAAAGQARESLASRIGQETASGLAALNSVVATAAQRADFIARSGVVIAGEVTPLAHLAGAGSPFSTAIGHLRQVQALASAVQGQNRYG